jgi:hypothetical protein
MRILFQLPRTNVLRHFDSVALELADRGHEVVIATPGRSNDWPLPETVLSHRGITRRVSPAAREDAWKEAATDFRTLVDCGHYLESPFFEAEKLRHRAFRTLARTLTGDRTRHLSARCPSCRHKLVDGDFGALQPALGRAASARLRNLARLIENAIPSAPGHEQFLRDERPDIVLVSPLVRFGSEQSDWVKSARALGIPVGFPVFSWDNLTTKGIIHVEPDRVFVWNALQKREATEYYGIPAEKVVVTGAPRFDSFIALTPSVDRQSYCRAFNLDPDAPIVTYLCSSEFVAGHEVAFVERWIGELRQDSRLAHCNVIVRPHPRSVRQWSGVDLTHYGRVALSSSRALNADQSLYDALYHSTALVGLNTSAQIEAAILGKPVFTLLAPGFEDGQQGTLHFRYLLREEGGFVEIAKGLPEHRTHLANALCGKYDADGVRRAVERFIRPEGWHRPATPILADAILELAPGKRSAVRRWLGTGVKPLKSARVKGAGPAHRSET